MPTFFLSRPAHPGTQTKDALRRAAETAAIPPRPNWRYPSHREFLDQLQHLCDLHGYQIGGEVSRPEFSGTKGLYQTTKSWQIHTRLGDSSVITYDAQTGEFHGRLRGSHWRPLAEHIQQVRDLAYDQAKITKQNVQDQIALMFMDSMPAAPFIFIEGTGRNLWMLVPAAEEDKVLAFYGTLRVQMLDQIEWRVDRELLERRVNNSLERTVRRLARSAGWVEIAQRSHQQLLSADKLPPFS